MSRRCRLGVAAVTLAAGLGLALAGCASFRAARLYGQGSEALERGDTRAAIQALERAAHLAPQASEIQNHLGLAYLAAGRPEAARAHFERAIELDCGNHAAAHNLEALDAEPKGAP